MDDQRAASAAVDNAVQRRGPTHINLQFAEPLLPAALPVDLAEAAQPVPHHQRQASCNGPNSDGSVRLSLGPRTVVVAGDDAGPQARLLAQRANWPLLAEPTSGCRTGTHAVRTYRLLLETELSERIERVVVIGHPTLSRSVTRLISRHDIEVVSVAGPSGVATDPGRVARQVGSLPLVEGADYAAWMNVRWRRADAWPGASSSTRWSPPMTKRCSLRVAAEIAAAVVPESLLVVGSSQPVRDLDLMMATYPAGERRLVMGNRGLAGIDGTVSTAVGAALARVSSRALAYLGDLTFLHDANGLVIGSAEPVPDLTIVVANDDGGAIFGTLEPGAVAYAQSFERVFGTPHGVDLHALCRATGTSYERADSIDDLRVLLAVAGDVPGIRVIEVPLQRSGRRALAAAVAALLGERRK